MYNFKMMGACLVAGFVLPACAISPPEPSTVVTQHERVQVEQSIAEIHALLDDQQAAWNDGDIDGFMQGYWKSPKLRFASGDKITYGWDETLAGYKARYTDRSIMGTLTFNVIETLIFGDDHATLFGKWQLTRPEKGDVGGLFTLMFRRIDGTWQIVSDHTS